MTQAGSKLTSSRLSNSEAKSTAELMGILDRIVESAGGVVMVRIGTEYREGVLAFTQFGENLTIVRLERGSMSVH